MVDLSRPVHASWLCIATIFLAQIAIFSAFHLSLSKQSAKPSDQLATLRLDCPHSVDVETVTSERHLEKIVHVGSSENTHPLFDASIPIISQVAALGCSADALFKPEFRPEDYQDTRPHLAVCVIGRTRTFPHMIVHETLKRNLIEAFGAKSTWFHFHLHNGKLPHPGVQESQDSTTPHFDETQLLRIARYVSNVDPKRISTAYRDNSTDSKLFSYIFPEANIIIDSRDVSAVEADSMKWYNYTGTCTHKASRPPHASDLGQISRHGECYYSILKQEEKMGRKFDYIYSVRPDLAYELPFRPYCFFPKDVVYRSHDWAFLAPRELMHGFRRIFDNYMACLQPDFGFQEPLAFKSFESVGKLHDNHNTLWGRVVRPHVPGFPLLCPWGVHDVITVEHCLEFLQNSTFNRYLEWGPE